MPPAKVNPNQMSLDPNAQLHDALSELTVQLTELNKYYATVVGQSKQSSVMNHPDQTAQQVASVRKSGSDYNLQQMGIKETMAAFKEMLAQEQPGRPGRVRRTLGEFAPQTGGSVSASASVPEEVGGQPMGQFSSAGGGGTSLGGLGGAGSHAGLSNQDALTLGVLGEHGGPAVIRNLALESYGLQRSLNWAQNTSQGLSNSSIVQSGRIPGVNPQNLQAAQGMLNLAVNNPGWAYAASKLVGGVGTGVGHINSSLSTMQTIGQQFGYGPPPGGQNVLGIRNPVGDFSNAAQVGASFEMEKHALEGQIPGQGAGSGLSESNAKSVLDTLGNQGFSMNPLSFSGDAATIAQNMMRPLMMSMPGLSAEDLGQFTPALRNSGESVQQLTETLANLGTGAQAAKETVGAFTSSVAEVGQAFEAMGSTPGGGYAIGMGFNSATGLDPQIAAQLAQSPMFQGLAMSQYGILPSGIGDMNAGAFSGTSMSMLKMLQNATAGLDRNKYTTRNGQRVLVQSGKQAQIDQIAEMSGLPSNIVKRMLGDAPGITARGTAEEMLGQAGNSTGMYQYINAAHGKPMDAKQYALAQQQWQKTVGDTWKGTGVSEAQMHHIDSIKNMSTRARDYDAALKNAAGSDKFNQISNNPNQQTVQITLQGKAAKIFGLTGPTVNKTNSNAGLSAINIAVNSVTQDTSSPAYTGGRVAALMP